MSAREAEDNPRQWCAGMRRCRSNICSPLPPADFKAEDSDAGKGLEPPDGYSSKSPISACGRFTECAMSSSKAIRLPGMNFTVLREPRRLASAA